MNTLAAEINRMMCELELTHAQVTQIMQQRGFSDGQRSRHFTNPAHTAWNGAHYNPHYERGYWQGYRCEN